MDILLHNHKKMKKAVNILITFLFLISFIGIQINKHYSHGKLYSVSLFKEAKTCCDKEGGCKSHKMPVKKCKHHKKKNKPCKDVSKVLKINKVFLKENLSFNHFTNPQATITTCDQLPETTNLFLLKNTFYFSSLPPPEVRDTQSVLGLFLC